MHLFQQRNKNTGKKKNNGWMDGLGFNNTNSDQSKYLRNQKNHHGHQNLNLLDEIKSVHDSLTRVASIDTILKPQQHQRQQQHKRVQQNIQRPKLSYENIPIIKLEPLHPILPYHSFMEPRESTQNTRNRNNFEDNEIGYYLNDGVENAFLESNNNNDELRFSRFRYDSDRHLRDHLRELFPPRLTRQFGYSSFENDIFITKGCSTDELDQLCSIQQKLKIIFEKEQKELDGDCSICFYGLQEPETSPNTNKSYFYLPCGHVFHETCILDWLKIRTTCPLCRENVSIELKKYTSSKNSDQNCSQLTGETREESEIDEELGLVSSDDEEIKIESID